jgi:hypothetical protein
LPEVSFEKVVFEKVLREHSVPSAPFFKKIRKNQISHCAKEKRSV